MNVLSYSNYYINRLGLAGLPTGGSVLVRTVSVGGTVSTVSEVPSVVA